MRMKGSVSLWLFSAAAALYLISAIVSLSNIVRAVEAMRQPLLGPLGIGGRSKQDIDWMDLSYCQGCSGIRYQSVKVLISYFLGNWSGEASCARPLAGSS
jgi:hypothetical protein